MRAFFARLPYSGMIILLAMIASESVHAVAGKSLPFVVYLFIAGATAAVAAWLTRSYWPR